MRTSRLAALFASIAIAASAACIEGGKCLRNSDCASADMCSLGACVPRPPEDGGLDEGGSAGDAGVTPTPDTGVVTIPDATTTSDASSSDASDDASDAANDASDATAE